MAVEKKFLKKALDDLEIKLFLFKEIERSGVSSISIQRTPIATRLSICVRRPGLVVGKRGKAIKELCDSLKDRFGIENPQIEIIEVMQASLDAKLMAERIGKQIELRPRVKPIVRRAITEIMEAGAIGAEIRVAGKIVGKGGKARTVTARKGYLKKSGEPMELVNKGHYAARTKAGSIGITVKIVSPETVFPDHIKVKPDVKPEAPKQEEKKEAPKEEEKKEAPKQEEKAEEKPAKEKKEVKPIEEKKKAVKKPAVKKKEEAQVEEKKVEATPKEKVEDAGEPTENEAKKEEEA